MTAEGTSSLKGFGGGESGAGGAGGAGNPVDTGDAGGAESGGEDSGVAGFGRAGSEVVGADAQGAGGASTHVPPDPPRFSPEELARLNRSLMIHEWAMRAMLTQVQAMSEDLGAFGGVSPIERFAGRIKAVDSIAAKLVRADLELTAENATTCLTDLAGIRIICSYTEDIHTVVDLLKALPDVTVIKEKDYVAHPKPSGYRSYHLIVSVPVHYSGGVRPVAVEFQVRTAAMDFWASLEHRVRYKYREQIPQHLCDELVQCADKIADLDRRMYLIHDIISLINQDVTVGEGTGVSVGGD